MLSRKIFENLHAIMTILVRFEKISRKFCLNFLTLSLSALPNMICSHIFDYASPRR